MCYWTKVFYAVGVGLYELRSLAFPDSEEGGERN